MNYHVLCENVCPTLNFYIGHTCITLSRRLTCHMSMFSAVRAYIDEYLTNRKIILKLDNILQVTV